MKRLSLLITMMLIGILKGQNISYLEYYFDTDPGRGSANEIVITPAPAIDVTYTVDISSLENGFHTLFIRATDDSGHWTFVRQNHFYKDRIPVDPFPDIVQLEHFIDSDPGFPRAHAGVFSFCAQC